MQVSYALPVVSVKDLHPLRPGVLRIAFPDFLRVRLQPSAELRVPMYHLVMSLAQTNREALSLRLFAVCRAEEDVMSLQISVLPVVALEAAYKACTRPLPDD